MRLVCGHMGAAGCSSDGEEADVAADVDHLPPGLGNEAGEVVRAAADQLVDDVPGRRTGGQVDAAKPEVLVVAEAAPHERHRADAMSNAPRPHRCAVDGNRQWAEQLMASQHTLRTLPTSA